VIFTRSLIPEILKCGLAYIPAALRYVRPGDRMKSAMPRQGGWWQRPGLGLMYQIEYRPGWEWDRDYIEFNASMRDENNGLRFNGPDCRISQWVDISKDVAAADYHILEIKWHDGICYFNTALTDWKTGKDYALEFAELSRLSNIPFMYYYSSVFDHNPQFDDIQPDPTITPSFIGLRPEKEYIDYLLAQYREILEQYAPDGLWLDWYWADRTTRESIDFLKGGYPDTVITFNLSNYFSTAFNKLHYTTGEAHTLSGPFVKLRTEASGVQVPVFSNAWKWSNLNRVLFEHPWELITPAGKWWQDHSLRDDPLDLVRMAAMVMASGGKICPGLTAQMDGTIYPDQVEQLVVLGDWYKPRKQLFTQAAPLRYRSAKVPGIRVSERSIKPVCALQDGDYILHLINTAGMNDAITVVFGRKTWRTIKEIVLEPDGKELAFSQEADSYRLQIRPEQLDAADTILRITPC
jgi:alpha-L-fucosidase